MGGQPDRPCFHVGYTITTDRLSMPSTKQVQGNGGHDGRPCGPRPWLVPGSPSFTVNAAYAGRHVAYPASVNVAVAVAMDDGGLLTPVLANADKNGPLFPLAQWADLGGRSRTKQAQAASTAPAPSPLQPGQYGVDRFDAILPPGTGASGRGASRPAWGGGQDGSISVKRQMQVNLTADHWVIYGTPRRGLPQGILPPDRNRPGKAWPSDVERSA